LVYSTGSGVIPATIGSGLTLAAGGTLSSTLSGGTVTSVTASGGTTGLSFSGSPITTAGTLTLAGTLGIGAGGTGTSTAFTTGSVVFAGASGVYSQNNSQLFWDNTNNRLGIGTSSPSYLLDVNGTAHASTITLGTAGTSTGSVILSGATSGTFTLSASAAAGTGYGFGHAGGSATQSNAALLATSGDTNTYIVLTSKGTGGIIAGPAPDGTATGGNARGTYAADLQISRTANTQVASGNGSALIGSVNATASGQNAVVNGGTGGLASGGNSIVLGGDRVTASGTNSGAGGETNTNASGFAAFAFGTSCAASGNRSIALGDGNTASIDAAFAVGYQNTANGFYSSVAGGAYASAKSRYAYQAFGSGRFSATGDALLL
jgi:hypothetical protein